MNQLSVTDQSTATRRSRPINPLGGMQIMIGILLIGSAAASFSLLPAAASVVGTAGLAVATAGSQNLFVKTD